MGTEMLARKQKGKSLEAEIIELQPIQYRTIKVEVQGVTPLIVNAWSEKAKRQMLDKQTGRAVRGKSPKDPTADYEASLYRFEAGGGYGFPAPGFKAAIVGACRLYDGALKMNKARMLFFIASDGIGTRQEALVRINGEPEMREDMVRVGGNSADIRYRGMFRNWTAILTVTFSGLSAEQVVNLINAAGVGGIGEWRPSKSATGDFGRFRVVGITVAEEAR